MSKLKSIAFVLALLLLGVSACTTASDAQPKAVVAPTAVPQIVAPIANPAQQGVQWSCAGPAPANVADAAKTLGVNPADAVLLTVLYPHPGDSTPIGYVLGTSASEAMNRTVTANTIPPCTTVDYDPGATAITGQFSHEYTFHPKWKRVTMAGQGSGAGLKMTIYWTPGVYPDGTFGVASTKFKCPPVAGVQTTLLSDGGCLMAANGPTVVKVESPFIKAVYDAGNSVTKTALKGETITTWTATLYTKE